MRHSQKMLRAKYSELMFIFFFQAEDGIRDHCVTGVQTCALPICIFRNKLQYFFIENKNGLHSLGLRGHRNAMGLIPNPDDSRSEERRVGKECRSRWWR